MANEPETIESTEYISAREESLFARDLDGQLIRVTDATLDDLEMDVGLSIDGQELIVKKAVPMRNSQGIIMANDRGEPIPRPTTIFDAVTQLYVKSVGDVNPIPVLCHREHLNPVGVCRVCMVEIEERRKSGRVKKDLVSSCTYHVKDGMIVTTPASQVNPTTVQRIKDSVAVIVDLLASEHLTEEDMASINDGLKNDPNELKRLVSQFTTDTTSKRYSPSYLSGKRGCDSSSEIISVDHDACILCQRCTRACNEVKQNDVMARSGKGYATRIAFDTDLPMLQSSCVSCGECVISCPTNALTFHPKVVKKQTDKISEQIRRQGGKEGDVLTVEEMLDIPIFAGIPYKFLQFNGGTCIRRILRPIKRKNSDRGLADLRPGEHKPDDVLCVRGEYGSTAFLILRGKFEILLGDKSNRSHISRAKEGRGISGFLRRSLGISDVSMAVPSLATGSDDVDSGKNPKLFRGVEDVIFGEMACLNRYPRTATVVAVEEAEVIEIGSNVLYMLQRNATSRKVLNEAYRKHALSSDLERLPIFESLSAEGRAEAAKIISESVDLMSVEPGRPIFKQGEVSDDLYLVRLGYVKVGRAHGTREQVVNYIGPGTVDGTTGSFGEIAALSSIYRDEMQMEFEQLGYRVGVRTSTCTALDHVELVRINSSQLKKIAAANPDFKKQLLDRARFLLQQDSERKNELSTGISNFVGQGLYNAQSLLVLDLESCTRCDECTRACADSHGGEPRLVREGLRFENFLVATSCRSCTDPYCLVGCPVNAIFREGSKEIVIEDHCIGCGQCANNCPYGNITMYGKPDGFRSDGDKRIPVIQQKATTCDQCKSIGGTPRCVYACPHDAAFRMSGEQLKQNVLAKANLTV